MSEINEAIERIRNNPNRGATCAVRDKDRILSHWLGSREAFTVIKSRPKVQKRGRPTIRRDQGEAGEWRRAKYRRNRCSPIVCMNVNGSPLFSLSSSLIFSHFFPSRLFPAYGFHRSSPLSLSPNAFGNIFPIVLTVLSLVLLPNFNGKLKKKVPLLPFRKFRYFAKDRCSIRSKNNAGKNEISWMMKQLFLKYFSAPSLLLNSLIHFTRIYILYIYICIFLPYIFHIQRNVNYVSSSFLLF